MELAILNGTKIKCVREGTIQVLNVCESQALLSKGKRGQKHVAMMSALINASNFLRIGQSELSTDQDFSKIK